MVTPEGSYESRDACLVNAVYSTKLTDAQNRVLARFEARTNIRPCFLRQYEQGLFTAEKLWQLNVGMARTIANDVQAYEFPPSEPVSSS